MRLVLAHTHFSAQSDELLPFLYVLTLSIFSNSGDFFAIVFYWYILK